MSSGAKRPRIEAVKEAVELTNLFAGCWERWEVAGSIRRGKDEVSDTEHVIIPKFADLPGDGLFAEPKATNLLWKRTDELVKAGTLFRHGYGATGFRWGDKYRGVDFNGNMHEMFAADERNWGATLAIRTGSADFSKGLVTGLLRNGRRNAKGYVWSCRPCPPSEHAREKCPMCDGTRLVPIEIIPAPTEEEYFRLCGMAWREPKERN